MAVTTNVMTIKPSGGDYTTLAAWEDGRDGNLTVPGDGSIEEAVCYSLDDTTAVLLTGWTTDADNYVYIHTDSTARHAGVWDGDKYNLLVANAIALNITEDYVRLDGLQIGVSAMDGNNDDPLKLGSITATNNHFRLSNLIIKGADDGTYTQYGIDISDGDCNVNLWNSIVYNVKAQNALYSIAVRCYGATQNVYSCTAIGGYRAIASGAGTVNAKNCYAGGSYSEDFSFIAGTYNRTNCASEDTSADDTGATETQTNCVNSIALSTSTFTNVTAGSENYHLVTGSGLIGTGVDTSGESDPLNFTTDIDGVARDSSWDIGADAWYVATGMSNDICIIFEC